MNKATIPGIVKRWFNHKKNTYLRKTIKGPQCAQQMCHFSQRPLGTQCFAAPLSSQTARKSDLLTIAWSKAGFDTYATGLIFKYRAVFFTPGIDICLRWYDHKQSAENSINIHLLWSDVNIYFTLCINHFFRLNRLRWMSKGPTFSYIIF